MKGFLLDHVEEPLNINETMLVDNIKDKVLSEERKVKLFAADSPFLSRPLFEGLEARRLAHIIARSSYGKGEISSNVLTIKDRLKVEDKYLLVVNQNLHGYGEGFYGLVKSGLGFSRFTW